MGAMGTVFSGVGAIMSDWKSIMMACAPARAIILLAGVLGLIPGMATDARAEGPYLTLIETIIDKNVWPAGQWTLSDGYMELDLHSGLYKVQFDWRRPPASIDASGFDMTLSVAGQVRSNCEPMYAGISSSGRAFAFSPDPPSADVRLVPPQNCDLKAGASGSGNVSVRVTPERSLSDGQVVELRVGAHYGPGVTYRYKVSNEKPPVIGGGEGGDGGDGGQGARLAAMLECDSDTITISALPSLNCHIVFTSWRRNTADPVIVSFPDERDTFGNHDNGIQLSGRGNEDIFNWDRPHRWGLFVFACPSQRNTGANCYDFWTVPGLATIHVRVEQAGTEPLDLQLTLNAVLRSNLTVEPGIDRPGLDYRSFDLVDDDAELCRVTCAGENICMAYTYVRAGVQGPRGRCWLKSAVPASRASDCCVSGVRR